MSSSTSASGLQRCGFRDACHTSHGDRGAVLSKNDTDVFEIEFAPTRDRARLPSASCRAIDADAVLVAGNGHATAAASRSRAVQPWQRAIPHRKSAAHINPNRRRHFDFANRDRSCLKVEGGIWPW